MRSRGLREDRQMKEALRGLIAQFQGTTNYAAVEHNRRERRRSKKH